MCLLYQCDRGRSDPIEAILFSWEIDLISEIHQEGKVLFP